MNRLVPALIVLLSPYPALAQTPAGPAIKADPAKLSAASPVEALTAHAEAGDVAAMFYLGVKYSDGNGVEKDETAALRWFRVVAEKGHVGAMLNIGNRYYNGVGAPVDRFEAVRWFLRAAKAGNPGAAYNLAVAYASGQGVEKNDDEAVKWFRAAAAKGNTRAKAALESRGLSAEP